MSYYVLQMPIKNSISSHAFAMQQGQWMLPTAEGSNQTATIHE